MVNMNIRVTTQNFGSCMDFFLKKKGSLLILVLFLVISWYFQGFGCWD